MNTEIVVVADESIEGIRDEKGQGWVVVKKMCEVLGLSPDAQRVKLLGTSWATTTNIAAVAKDGKLRDLFCLSVDSVPMWLVTIDENRINDAARPKLQKFQREASKALAAWVRGEQLPARPIRQEDAMVQQARLFLQMAERQAEIERKALEAHETAVAAREHAIMRAR